MMLLGLVQTAKHSRGETDMRIAVISDTHGLLRPEVLDVIETCEVIIHGGDINNAEILQELSDRRPLYMVRGNNDKEWAKSIPETRQFELAGLTFFAVHNKKDVPEDLSGVDVIIFGHSHKYFEEVRDGRLWLNPGSCGRRRFSQPITMAVMEVENGVYKVERIDIPAGEGGKESKGIQPSDKNRTGNLSAAVDRISKGFAKEETVENMARKLNLERDFVEEICRIIVTHPGVTREGILNKIEANSCQRQSRARKVEKNES